MIHDRPPIDELDQLQRKAHAARRGLNTVQSETRAALQLVAQLDDEIAALRRRHQPAQPARAQQPPAQPEEAQHAHEDRQAAHA